jgi:hypothetical protein
MRYLSMFFVTIYRPSIMIEVERLSKIYGSTPAITEGQAE